MKLKEYYHCINCNTSGSVLFDDSVADNGDAGWNMYQGVKQDHDSKNSECYLYSWLVANEKIEVIDDNNNIIATVADLFKYWEWLYQKKGKHNDRLESIQKTK